MKIFLFLHVILFSTNLLAQEDEGKVLRDTSRWDLATLNSGASADYLSRVEQEVLLEINKARSDPARYARIYLKPMLAFFKDKLDTRHNLMTTEGSSAVLECIAQMERTARLGTLAPDKQLAAASRRHTSLQSKTREIGHTSPNGETFEYRLRNQPYSITAECISYGESEAREIVISLLVDDGVPSRGHRQNLLNPRLTAIGIAAGGHEEYGSMCTIDLGGGKFTGNR